MGIQPTIDTGIFLRFAKSLNVPCVKFSIGPLFSRAAALDSSSSLVWIPAAPGARLAVDLFPVALSELPLIRTMTDLAHAGYAIMFRGVVEKIRKWLNPLASPASLHTSIIKPLLCPSILNGIRVPRLLAAYFTTRGTPVAVSRVLVKFRQGLDLTTSRTTLAIHLTSASESASLVGGGGCGLSRFSARRPSPTKYYNRMAGNCQGEEA